MRIWPLQGLRHLPLFVIFPTRFLDCLLFCIFGVFLVSNTLNLSMIQSNKMVFPILFSCRSIIKWFLRTVVLWVLQFASYLYLIIRLNSVNESLLCLSIKKVSHPPLQSSTDWRAKIQCLALLILGIWNKFMFPCDKRSRGLYKMMEHRLAVSHLKVWFPARPAIQSLHFDMEELHHWTWHMVHINDRSGK